MLFGDPTIFAVETALGEKCRYVGNSLAGHIRVHVGGKSLGNFNEPLCVYGPIAHHLTTISATSGALWHQSLASHTPDEIFQRLNGALFTGEVEPYPSEYDLMGFLTNVSEAFNSVKAFVVRPSKNLLLLLAKQSTSAKLLSSSVPLAAFSSAAAAFGAWVSQQELAAKGEA